MHKSTVGIVGIALAALLLAACPQNPADQKPKANVTDVAGGTAGGGTMEMPEGAKALTSSNTEITWVGSKVTRSHDGGFKGVEGYVTLSDNSVTKIHVVIDMTTVYADNGSLTRHLKTDDFFDVGNHPTATFTSTEIGANTEVGSYTVTGNVTIRGVTKQISFPAKMAVAGDNVQLETEFSLERKQFGVKWEGKPDDLVRDDVAVKIRVDTSA